LKAWDGITQALREANILPQDVLVKEQTIDVDDSEIISLEEAQKVLSGPQLMMGEVTVDKGGRYPEYNFNRKRKPVT
jgi:hypothetical protein